MIYDENADPFALPEPGPSRLSLDDAPLPLEEMNRRFSAFTRFPDWRVLHQTKQWINADKTITNLSDLDPSGLHALLLLIRGMCDEFHTQAALDECFATSSAMAWAHHQLQIPYIRDLHPLVWLDSTPLVRHLQRVLGTDV